MRAKELTVYRDDFTIMWTKRILVLFTSLVLFASTVFGMGQSAIAAVDSTSLEGTTSGNMGLPAATAEGKRTIQSVPTAEPLVRNSAPTTNAGSDPLDPSSLVPSEGSAPDTSSADKTAEVPPAEFSPADQEVDPPAPDSAPSEPGDQAFLPSEPSATEDRQSAIVDDPTVPEMSQGLAGPEAASAQLLNIGPQTDGLATPEALFKEDFENGSAAVPLALGSYQSATGIKYTASDYWRDAKYCNGFITTAESNPTRNDIATKYCGLNGDSTDNNLGDYNAVRTKAQALGTFANQMDGTSSTATTNRALSTNTSGGTPDNEMFKTASNSITLKNSVDKRFFAFSVDAAVTYEEGTVPNKPEMYFSLVKNGQPAEKLYDTGASIPGTGGVPFDLYKKSPVNSNQKWASQGIVGRFYSNSFLMEGNQQIGLLLENFSRASSEGCGAYSGTTANPAGCTNTGNAWRQGTANGNDGAIDNIRISDVSPTTEKAFSPGRVPVGQTSTMTITVKNRTDLQRKDGWKFVDSLPAGLEFANANVGGTCVASGSQIAVDRNARTLTVTRGILNKEQESCTITTTVTSQQAKLFTNGGPNGNFPSRELVGIDAPNNANVEFYEPSALQCSANIFYTVREDGELRRGTVGSNQTTLVGT